MLKRMAKDSTISSFISKHFKTSDCLKTIIFGFSLLSYIRISPPRFPKSVFFCRLLLLSGVLVGRIRAISLHHICPKS